MWYVNIRYAATIVVITIMFYINYVVCEFLTPSLRKSEILEFYINYVVCEYNWNGEYVEMVTTFYINYVVCECDYS